MSHVSQAHVRRTGLPPGLPSEDGAATFPFRHLCQSHTATTLGAQTTARRMSAWAWVLLLLAAWGAAFGYLLNLRVALRRQNDALRWRAMLLRAVCLQRWTLN